MNAKRTDLDDARVDMAIVGDDPGLTAGEADRIAAQFTNREREQGHRDSLAGREQHVELATLGVGRNLLRHRQQLVSGIAHGRHDDDHPMAPARRLHYTLGDISELADIRDAAAAVLLDDDGHGEYYDVPSGPTFRSSNAAADTTPSRLQAHSSRSLQSSAFTMR